MKDVAQEYRKFLDSLTHITDREIDENARRERSPLAERWAYLDWRDKIAGRHALEAREGDQ